MRPRSGLPTIAWVLLGLLALSSALLTLGSAGGSRVPSANAYDPAGTRAFRELLSASGYRVSVTNRSKPRIPRNALAVAFFLEESAASLGPSAADQVKAAVREHAANGGSALVLEVADLARDEILAIQDAPSRAGAQLDGGGPSLSISAAENPTGWSWSEPDPWANSLVTLWSIDGVPFIVAEIVESGTIVHVADGTGATNRFLDLVDNAGLYLGLVRQLTDMGSEILILDAANSPPQEPALVDYLGSWAAPSWYQAIFVLLVVVMALGVRFGLPATDRASQRGTRDLVDALAGTYARARATDAAAAALAEEADRAIRSRLKLTRDAPVEKRDVAIPPELAAALREVEDLSKVRAPESVAVPSIRRLESALGQFTKDGQSDRPPKRR